MASLSTLWKWFSESVAVIAFAVMFAGFVIGIGGRYVFDAPVSWSNELCAIGYVWVVFWTSDILLKERQHIVFDVIYGWFPPRGRRVLAIFITLSLAIVFLAAIPGTIDYMYFLRTRKTTLLQWPILLVFGSFLIFMIAVAVQALIRLWHLLRSGWQNHI
ncbi:TRAP transporter small permease [Aestuariivirga sp.]|uniref:TRAP transporter small permease n=1 Tax=Aestuariivirga sp. TaxID=2650926 RepID=UPI0039E289AE